MKKAKRPALSEDTFELDHPLYTSYYREYTFGLNIMVGDRSIAIPWPMLIASVRRYQSVQRHKAKRRAKG